MRTKFKLASLDELRFPIYLSLTKVGALTVPGILTQSEYELLKTQIDFAMATIQQIAIAPSAVEASTPEGSDGQV